MERTAVRRAVPLSTSELKEPATRVADQPAELTRAQAELTAPARRPELTRAQAELTAPARRAARDGCLQLQLAHLGLRG